MVFIPLADHMSRATIQVMQERETFLQQAIDDSVGMLQVLQKLKSGDLDIDRLVVSDDGWRMMPDDPKSNGKVSKKEAEESTRNTP